MERGRRINKQSWNLWKSKETLSTPIQNKEDLRRRKEFKLNLDEFTKIREKIHSHCEDPLLQSQLQ